MNLLIIKYLLTGDFSEFLTRAKITGIIGIIVILAHGVDFIIGLRRARRLGIPLTSSGFRRTVKKTNQSFLMLFFGLLIDEFLLVYFKLPYVSFALAVFIVFCEGWSVWESFSRNDKKKYKNRFNDLTGILRALKDNELDELVYKIEERRKMQTQQEYPEDNPEQGEKTNN